MIWADLPPQIHERVICSIEAAVRYDVPANIVLAVAELENGKPGMYRSNDNGTKDVGTMQFNTSYLSDLSVYGIRPKDVAVEGCYPYQLATWRIRNHLLQDQGDIWTRAANYHSRTPEYNMTYRRKLKKAAIKWANWLTQNFKTRPMKSG